MDMQQNREGKKAKSAQPRHGYHHRLRLQHHREPIVASLYKYCSFIVGRWFATTAVGRIRRLRAAGRRPPREEGEGGRRRDLLLLGAACAEAPAAEGAGRL